MKKILGILIVVLCFLMQSSVLAKNENAIDNVKNDKKYKFEVKKSNNVFEPEEVNSSSEKTPANPLYPAKYTTDYIKDIRGEYTCSAKEEVFIVALDMLKGTTGEFSRNAILGKNLTGKSVKITFKDLKAVKPEYDSFDALGWRKGNTLYIYVNQKHNHSPAIAIAALLAHEACHQDQYNSLAEETYAWTMEAAVWCELLELYPDYELGQDALVQREMTLKKLFEKGNYTNKYIKKTVHTNESYQNIPETSPGFEDL